jgi:quercetin dioxygenase-like cupin family protein
MERSNNFQMEAEIKWEDLGGGVQRQILGYDDQIMLVKVKFEKGAVGAMHSHPHVQASHVHSGVFEATVGDRKQILKEGDGFYAEPNVMHGVVCLEPGILIDAFSPHRADFLHNEAV